jgi:hypothetical protein
MPADRRLTDDDPKKEETFAEEKMSQKDLAARIRDLENALATTRAGLPLSLLPPHGAGPDDEIRGSWSQYEQELATRGEELP